MYNHLILRSPKSHLEQNQIAPIPNCQRLTDVDAQERVKLYKNGLDMISRGKRIDAMFIRMFITIFNKLLLFC